VRAEVIVPEVGETGMDVTFAGWLRNEGDAIAEGDPLFELDTAKAVMEVQAFTSGVLTGLQVAAGDTVAPHQVVAYIEADNASQPVDQASTTGEPRAAAESDERSQRVDGMTSSSSSSSSSGPAAGPTERGRASPRARRLAAELGLQLDEIAGTGPAGLITERDVRAGAQSADPSERIRRAVALRTLDAWRSIPHFSLRLEADVTGGIKHWRPMTLMSAAMVRALIEHPECNLRWEDDRPVRRETVDLGILVDTPTGLLLLAVVGAQAMDPPELEQAIKHAVDRAREGRLEPSDEGSHSVTVSSLGMFSVDEFTGVIPPSDVLLMSFGRLRHIPLWDEGKLVVRAMVTITLSADHRALSGADGARLLTTVERVLREMGAIEQ
jgi:pyruvate dehydrogenase E2 component (dihydrolipoamide acetyltransferase)